MCSTIVRYNTRSGIAGKVITRLNPRDFPSVKRLATSGSYSPEATLASSRLIQTFGFTSKSRKSTTSRMDEFFSSFRTAFHDLQSDVRLMPRIGPGKRSSRCDGTISPVHQLLRARNQPILRVTLSFRHRHDIALLLDNDELLRVAASNGPSGQSRARRLRTQNSALARVAGACNDVPP